MYGCESWTIKEAECQRIDDFELWCWTRLLRVLWTARRSNQSILKSVLGVHWKDWCWSWNSNILATWCEGLTNLKKTLIWGKIGGRRRRGWQMRWLDCITDSMDMGLGKLWELVMAEGGLACCGSWGRRELDTTERLNWTETDYHNSTDSNRKRKIAKEKSLGFQLL